jgi:hypothetical protein
MELYAVAWQLSQVKSETVRALLGEKRESGVAGEARGGSSAGLRRTQASAPVAPIAGRRFDIGD